MLKEKFILGAVTHTIINPICHGKLSRGASHLGLEYQVNRRSHDTKITEVKIDVTQFIDWKVNHNVVS